MSIHDEQKKVATGDLASAIEYADARWSGVDVPVEWLRHFVDGLGAQQRTWIGLTDKEISQCVALNDDGFIKPLAFYKAVEAKLKENNITP